VTVDRDGLIAIASECVSLVRSDFGVSLDWTPETLEALDVVCGQLSSDHLAGDRFDLWWKLVGAYLGEVVIRTHGGEWIAHEQAGGAYAVSAMGIVGFPFSTAERVLQGEPFKSLASFARSIPAIAERSQEDRPPDIDR